MAGRGVVPPLAFAVVSAGVYRSGFPVELNFAFLAQLGLRTLVCLSPAALTRALRDFCHGWGIDLVEVDPGDNQEPFREMDHSALSAVVDVLRDPRRHPVLVHCMNGNTRTGSAIACFRAQAQDWTLSAALDEYCRFAAVGPGGRQNLLDLQFIEQAAFARRK